eukprot:6172320-Pleurochrysis_carterae.AAC.2
MSAATRNARQQPRKRRKGMSRSLFRVHEANYCARTVLEPYAVQSGRGGSLRKWRASGTGCSLAESAASQTCAPARVRALCMTTRQKAAGWSSTPLQKDFPRPGFARTGWLAPGDRR